MCVLIGWKLKEWLVHGATGGRSCYKTCHFLSSSKLWPILPHFAGAHRLRRGQGQKSSNKKSLIWPGLNDVFVCSAQTVCVCMLFFLKTVNIKALTQISPSSCLT